MNYEEFALGLPLDQTIVFRSAEESEETMRHLGVDQDVRQLGKGRFRSDMAVRITDQADFFADRFNTPVSMHLEPPKGHVGILFPLSADGHFFASGEDASNDKLIVMPKGSEADIVSTGLVGSEAIAVPEERFIEMTEVLSPTVVRPERMTVIEGNPVQQYTLRKAVRNLVAHPELKVHDEDLSNLLAATISWIGHFTNQWRSEGFTVTEARIRVAKRARDYIEANYRNAVRIEDLCRITGVGVRTLQRCFREYFTLSITEYLKTIRLNAVHRALVNAHPSQTTVSKIALQHGFTHLGRFSIEYRQRFGESPSETLAMHAGRKSRVKDKIATTPDALSIIRAH